jgi:Tol biopolymer transport system component
MRVRGHTTRFASSVAVVACAAAALAAPAGATFPGRNGRIAFERSSGGGAEQLFSIRPDGTGRRRIASRHEDLNTVDAAYSANGRRLVYARGSPDDEIPFRLMIAHADGSHAHHLTPKPTPFQSPAFSPNGKTIVANQGGGFKVVAMRSNGTDIHALGPGAGASPEISPNGDLIVVGCQFNGQNYGPCAMNRDGSDLHQLVFLPPGDLAAYGNFSPNGRKIVFSRSHKLQQGGLDWSICTVRLSDLSVQTIRDFGSSIVGNPVFAPNGKRIAFSRAPSAHPEHDDIYTMRTDGSDLRRLTRSRNSGVENRVDDWQPLR